MKNNPLNIAIVGATGMVGQEFLKILDQQNFEIGEIRLFASDKSAGVTISSKRGKHHVQPLKAGCFKGCHVAFFSAGNAISLEWAPKAVSEGCFVIDNSSAFRMDPNIPLVVPEVNSARIPPVDKPAIIANPNCSTIQLVCALKPLSDEFGIRSVIVSTYQSVSGAGKEGVQELLDQTQAHFQQGQVDFRTFPHNIAFTNIPHIDVFDSSGFTKEELKVINESRKILEISDLDISCTAVRTPTLNSHSEAVWVEINKQVDLPQFRKCLENAQGIEIQDDTGKNLYPLNSSASGKDPVYVGRIRKDISNPKRWLFWVVSDNIRKGAALNGMQIARKLFNLKA